MDVALDPRSGFALADYTWLPTSLHTAFQATLETDDGVAAVHFCAEVERMTKKQYHRRVVIVSSDAVYLCTVEADITRCVLLDRIAAILTCDEWICLCVPNEYDMVFRVTSSNSSSCCHQRFVIDVINGLRRRNTGSLVSVQPVTSMHALASRQIERPSGFQEQIPIPIDVISYADLRRVDNAHLIVANLLPQHAAQVAIEVPTSRQRPHLEIETLSNQPTGRPRSPIQVPPRTVDVAVSASTGAQLNSPNKRREAATSPIQLKSPVVEAARTQEPSFSDPRIDLIWTELKEQRQLMDQLQSQIRLLIADRFPVSARPTVADAEAVSGKAALPYVLRDQPEPTADSPRRRPRSATRLPPSPAPAENNASRLRKHRAAEKLDDAERERMAAVASHQLDATKRLLSQRPVDRPSPARLESAVAGLGELSVFQRRLMNDLLSDRPPSPEGVKPARLRATPEDPNPPETLFVRTKFAAKAGSTSPRRRETVAVNRVLQDPSQPHYLTGTRASRGNHVLGRSSRN